MKNNTTIIRSSTILAGALVGLFMLAQTAEAQDYRSQRTFYIAPSIGISNYVGDADMTPLNMDDWRADSGLPWSGGLELGYQLTTRFAMGGEYRLANYPSVVANANNFSRRHTASLVMRYTPNATVTRLIPYIQGGLQGTVGMTRFSDQGREDLFSMGPWLGVGVDYAMNPSTSLFFGINTRMNVPDQGVDGFSKSVDGRGRRFDMLSDASFGIRYRLKPALGGL